MSANKNGYCCFPYFEDNKMVSWFCKYINNVKLALPLHPELMFNENFIATYMALFMKYKLHSTFYLFE